METLHVLLETATGSISFSLSPRHPLSDELSASASAGPCCCTDNFSDSMRVAISVTVDGTPHVLPRDFVYKLLEHIQDVRLSDPPMRRSRDVWLFLSIDSNM